MIFSVVYTIVYYAFSPVILSVGRLYMLFVWQILGVYCAYSIDECHEQELGESIKVCRQ